MILAPDTEQQAIYRADDRADLKPGDALLFAHGFNIRFGLIRRPRGRRGHGRPEGSRPPGAPHLRGRRWRAGA